MDAAFPSATSPSYISTPKLLFREALFCGVCRALAASPEASPGSLLLLPLALRPQLEEALAVLVGLLDGVHPPPGSTAVERSSLAALPRAPRVQDLSRVAIKYLAPSRKCGGAGSGSLFGTGEGGSSSAAAPAVAGAPDLLTYASAFHGMAQRPGWVGLVAPELMVGMGLPEGATPPRPDAQALNAALALLSGAPGSPALHVHFLAPHGECGPPVARVLQRASEPLVL